MILRSKTRFVFFKRLRSVQNKLECNGNIQTFEVNYMWFFKNVNKSRELQWIIHLMFQILDTKTYTFSPEITLSVNVLELVFLILFIFELGFLVGKQWQFKWIVRAMMTNRFLSLPPPAQSEVRKQSFVSQDSTASDCLSMVADKQNLDPDNVENLFFQQKIPFQAPKRNTKANFQVILERKGSSLFKVEKYEQVSQFESSSSAATYEFNKLKQTMKRMSQSDNEGQKNGIELKLSKSQNPKKTSVLFKRISFKESENHKIQIEGLCQNGKFKVLFQNIKKIGEGGFGAVFEATHKVQRKQYAIKKIFLKDLKKKDLLRQVTIVNHLTHANIVRYYTWWIEQISELQKKQTQLQYDIQTPQLPIQNVLSINSFAMSSNSQNSIVFQDSQNKKKIQPIKQKNQLIPTTSITNTEPLRVYSLHIQMQLYKDGTLQEFLKNKERKIDPSKAFCIIKQLFNGLQFLHSHCVIHRDLKPANVFLDQKQKLIKIGDFGLSVFVDKQISLSDYMLSNKLGTPCYMAPEIKQNCRIPQPELLDVYSLGVIYYQLLTKFQSQHQRISTLKDIQHGKIILQEYPLQKQLIRKMTRNHRSRLPISKLRQSKQFKQLTHKYQGVNWFDKQ